MESYVGLLLLCIAGGFGFIGVAWVFWNAGGP